MPETSPTVPKLVPVADYFQNARGRKAARFVRVPESVVAAPTSLVSDGAFRLYCFLLKFVTWRNTASEVFPGVELMASGLGISTKTVRRRLGELEKLGLIRTVRDSRPTVYEVRAFDRCWDPSGQASGRTCPEARTDLSLPNSAREASMPQEDGDLVNDRGNEREPQNESNERETQACDSFDYRPLLDVGFSKSGASALVAKYGVELVSQALARLAEEGDNVQNPPAWVTAYLKTRGWEDKQWLEDYLLHMPDPRTGADRVPIVADLRCRYGGRDGALRALDSLLAEKAAIVRSGGRSGPDLAIAGKLQVRAAEAKHFVDEYYRGHPEELEDPAERARALEMWALLRDLRRELPDMDECTSGPEQNDIDANAEEVYVSATCE